MKQIQGSQWKCSKRGTIDKIATLLLVGWDDNEEDSELLVKSDFPHHDVDLKLHNTLISSQELAIIVEIIYI